MEGREENGYSVEGKETVGGRDESGWRKRGGGWKRQEGRRGGASS